MSAHTVITKKLSSSQTIPIPDGTITITKLAVHRRPKNQDTCFVDWPVDWPPEGEMMATALLVESKREIKVDERERKEVDYGKVGICHTLNRQTEVRDIVLVECIVRRSDEVAT
jgi:hypothetical protein